MSQHIEREFKCLLSQTTYQYLFVTLPFHRQTPLHQDNRYFDSPDGALRAAKMGLRLRRQNDRGEFTLKVQIGEHEQLEITDTLSETVLAELLHTQQPFREGAVQHYLATHGLGDLPLQVIGQLRNLRFEYRDAAGTWVLDQADFPSGRAYELEFEADNVTTGQLAFERFLSQHNIPYQPAPTKLAHTCGSAPP